MNIFIFSLKTYRGTLSMTLNSKKIFSQKFELATHVFSDFQMFCFEMFDFFSTFFQNNIILRFCWCWMILHGIKNLPCYSTHSQHFFDTKFVKNIIGIAEICQDRICWNPWNIRDLPKIMLLKCKKPILSEFKTTHF